MATKARIAITAENQMSKGLLESKKATAEWAQSIQKIGKNISAAFSVAGIALAIKGISNAVGSCVKDFTEADRKYKQLALTLGNGKAFQQASNTIEKLRKVTLSSKDEIESIVSELAALGKSSDEIDKIASAAVALSNVTGRDLNSSMTTLLNTYKGTTTQLNKLGVQTSQFTKEELAAGAAVDLINEKFGKLSEEMAKNDISQNWKNIKDNLGDIKQSVGDLITFSFSGLIAEAATLSETLNSGFNEFVQNIKLIVPALPQVFAKLGETLSNMFAKLFSGEGIINYLTGVVKTAVNFIRYAAKMIVNILNTAISTIPENLITLLSALGDFIMSWVTDLTTKAKLNITGAVNEIGKTITDSTILSAIDKIISIEINSIRMLISLIGNIPKAVDIVIDNVGTVVSGFFKTLKNAFYGALTGITQALGNVLSVINVPQLAENVSTAFTNVFGNISGWFKALGTTALNTFKYIGEVIKATFSKTMLDDVFNRFTAGFEALGATVKNVFVYIGEVMKAIFSWDTLKSTAVHMVESFLNFFVDKINALIAKLPKLLKIDQIDRVSLSKEQYKNPLANVKAPEVVQSKYKGKELDAYKNLGSIEVAKNDWVNKQAAEKISQAAENLLKFSEQSSGKITDVKAYYGEVGKQFAQLLTPVFEEFKANNAQSFGEILSTWEQKSSKEYLDSAGSKLGEVFKNSFADLKDVFGDRWDMVSSQVGIIAEVINKDFGSDAQAYADWFADFLEQLKKETKAIQSIDGKLDDDTGGGSKQLETIVEKLDGNASWYEQLKQTLFGYEAKVTTFDEKGNATTTSEWMTGAFGATKQDSEFMGGVLDNLKNSLGIFGDMIIGINPLLAVLKPVLEGFVSVMGPMIEAVLLPLQSTLTYIGELIAGLFAPVLDKIAPVFQFVANILAMVIQPVLAMMQAPLAIIAALLEFLTPVLNMVGKAFEYLMIPLNAIAATFEWVSAWIRFIILGIYNAFSWIWGGTVDNPTPDSWQSYYNNLQQKTQYTAVGDTGVASTIAEGMISGTSTSTGVTNASYQGGGSLTMNIYVQAPIVGSGGMEEFAIMIRKEMEAIGYYNVA